MRFLALVVGGLAAFAAAAPVVVTRTTYKVVTVHGHQSTRAPSYAVHHVVTATRKVATVTASAVVVTGPAKVITVSAAAPAAASHNSHFHRVSSAVAHKPASTTKMVHAPVSSSANYGSDDDDGVGSDCESLHEDDPQLCQDSLDAHNRHRRNHTVPDMKWSKDLFESASFVASQCNFSHLMDYNGGGYGQNLEIGSPRGEIQHAITNGWYNSEVGFWPDSYYGQPTPPDMIDPSSTTWERYGHFTQVIWAASDQVGCAQAECQRLGCGSGSNECHDGYLPDGKYGRYLTVCNYKSVGNVKGEFDKNVIRPPVDEPTYVAP
ncbi:pr-1-like protein [Diplodia corticola]|uniref:Pr-1-like protein n=1 Tax=Diplodia corticola TaxID=236234 RepID=A0A1J9QRH4_9PEZI|nr:pr-1-like protein [Diplodia corticola]OJD31542.1 pr-1-like protein [Diplodia corticola]